jgi:hypothetical protein
MNVLALGGEFMNLGRRDFDADTWCNEELGAIGKEFWCAAFIRFNVGSVATNDAMVRLAKRRQSKGICGRSVEDKEDLAIGFEEFAKRVRCFGGPGVVTVCGDMAVICGLRSRGGSGTDSGVIVARELLNKVFCGDSGHYLNHTLLKNVGSRA